MLIIAIPKSASTSIMKTLGKIHRIKAIQDFSFADNPIPDNVNILNKYHSDIREITSKEVSKFSSSKILYKQHIFPTSNNLKLLQSIKKVILLRDTIEIILAYRRGAYKKVHTLEEFSLKSDQNKWIERAKEIGLYSDLEYFNRKWKENSDHNTLFIEYSDLIETPHTVLNKVEEFFNLPVTRNSFTLSKARYSRRNLLIAYFFFLVAVFRKLIVKIITILGLKDTVKSLLNR